MINAQQFQFAETAQTTVRGVVVEGFIEGNLHNIKITITSPFKNISDSRHIAYFAQGALNYDSELKELRAKESLKDIYFLADYVHRKDEMLKRKYQELEARKVEVSEGRLSEGEFKLQRYTMRNQLKSGDISNMELQRRIGVLRREVEALGKCIWRLEDKFFEAYFPMSVYGGLRESVIDILDGKNSLV